MTFVGLLGLLAAAATLPCKGYEVRRAPKTFGSFSVDRRTALISSASLATLSQSASRAVAANFTPGGTLVDRPTGVTVGNPEANANRASDNTNVLFQQDYYFKFGAAAPWITEANRADFPTTMPFTRVQQRYDAYQKYASRVRAGLQAVADWDLNGDKPNADSSQFALRAAGLFANSMCASENTGTTNELFLARWYVNEIYLSLQNFDKQSKRSAILAANSYLNMMNRVISPKVGDKLELLPTS